MAQKYSRTSALAETSPPYVLDLDMATALVEEAGSLVMAPTMPWLGLGVLRPLNPYKIATTPSLWSVYSTKCPATVTHSFYHSMKPSGTYSNPRHGEPYYAGNHSGTDQVPRPTMGFLPRLPEADPSQEGASSEWRFDTCWVSHADENIIHLTISLKKS
jgi:hypothetical protein